MASVFFTIHLYMYTPLNAYCIIKNILDAIWPRFLMNCLIDTPIDFMYVTPPLFIFKKISFWKRNIMSMIKCT